MSLLGIMKLLDHRDQRMTLCYTLIADDTVGREYFEALSRIAGDASSSARASRTTPRPIPRR